MVKNKIGEGGRNEREIRHATKRQKSRAAAGVMVNFFLFYFFLS